MDCRLLIVGLLLASCVATIARPLPRHTGAAAADSRLPARRISSYGALVAPGFADMASELLQGQLQLHPRSLQQQAAARPATTTDAKLHDAVLDQRPMSKVYHLQTSNRPQQWYCAGRWC